MSIMVDYIFFFSSRRRHTRFDCDWSSDVCSSDLREFAQTFGGGGRSGLFWAWGLLLCYLRRRDVSRAAGGRGGGRGFGHRRSEERRVGKECRFWWSPYQYKKKKRRGATVDVSRDG